MTTVETETVATAVEEVQSLAERLAIEAEAAARPERAKNLRAAGAAGAKESVLRAIAEANRCALGGTVMIPCHRYEYLSRGSGWCRRGTGPTAAWGERVDGGYLVGPGRWLRGATDGYSRNDREYWTVKTVSAGGLSWTIAS